MTHHGFVELKTNGISKNTTLTSEITALWSEQMQVVAVMVFPSALLPEKFAVFIAEAPESQQRLRLRMHGRPDKGLLLSIDVVPAKPCQRRTGCDLEQHQRPHKTTTPILVNGSSADAPVIRESSVAMIAFGGKLVAAPVCRTVGWFVLEGAA